MSIAGPTIVTTEGGANVRAASYDNDAILHAVVEAWNDRNSQTLVEVMDPGIVWYDPSLPEPIVGIPQVRAFAETVWLAFPDLRYEVRRSFMTEDGLFAVWWTMRGTNSGPMTPPGFAPTGKPIDISGVDVVEVSAGLVVRIDTYFNPITLAEQLLGMRLQPRAGSIGEKGLVKVQRAVAWWLRASGRGSKSTDAIG